MQLIMWQHFTFRLNYVIFYLNLCLQDLNVDSTPGENDFLFFFFLVNLCTQGNKKILPLLMNGRQWNQSVYHNSCGLFSTSYEGFYDDVSVCVLIHAKFFKTYWQIVKGKTHFICFSLSYCCTTPGCNIAWQLPFCLFKLLIKWHMLLNFEWPHMLVYKQVNAVNCVSVCFFGKWFCLDAAVPIKSQWRRRWLVPMNSCHLSTCCCFSAVL